MRTTTARRNAAMILATVALVASAGAAAGIGTFGGSTDAGPVVQAVRAIVVRYGAVWIALGGVALLGLSLVWRQPPPRHRAPAPVARPRLTLVTSEPRP